MGHQEDPKEDRSDDGPDNKDEDSKLPAQHLPQGQEETIERPITDQSSLSVSESEEQQRLRGSVDSNDQQESTAVASLSQTYQQQNPQIASQFQDQNTNGMSLPMMINPYYAAAVYLNPMGSNMFQSQLNLQQAAIQQATSNLIASMMLHTAATLTGASSGTSPAVMPGFTIPRQQQPFLEYVVQQPPQQAQQVRASEASRSSFAFIDDSRTAALTNRSAVPLYLDYDEESLNEYQCILRKQIELFETKEEDIKGNSQGRNQPIFIGQVGIRCR